MLSINSLHPRKAIGKISVISVSGISIFCSFVQYEKACEPIVLSDVGNLIVVRSVHTPKVSGKISVIPVLDISMLFRFEQP